MKLNKKVLTGALALAMGLGVAAPAVNSFAAKADSTMEIVEKEYRAKGEAWLKAYNELEDAKALKQELKDKVEAEKVNVQKAVDAHEDAKKLNAEAEQEAKDKAQEDLTKAEKALQDEKDGK